MFYSESNSKGIKCGFSDLSKTRSNGKFIFTGENENN